MKQRLKAALANSSLPFVRRWLKGLQAQRRQARRDRLHRAMRAGAIQVVTFEDAAAWTREWLETLPRDVDVIVGVPRSGLLFADIIALSLAKPLATPDLLERGRPWTSRRFLPPEAITSALVVEDSIDTGKSLQQAVEQVRAALPEARVLSCALIGRPGQEGAADYIHRFVPQPRLFEWDLMHQKKAKHLAIALEGVLAPSPPSGLDAAGYEAWLAEAGPGRLPAFEVDTVVAFGPAGTEEAVSAYLGRHGVAHGNVLVSGADWPEALKRGGGDLFFAPDDARAEQAWNGAGVATLAFDTMTLYAA